MFRRTTDHLGSYHSRTLAAAGRGTIGNWPGMRHRSARLSPRSQLSSLPAIALFMTAARSTLEDPTARPSPNGLQPPSRFTSTSPSAMRRCSATLSPTPTCMAPAPSYQSSACYIYNWASYASRTSQRPRRRSMPGFNPGFNRSWARCKPSIPPRSAQLVVAPPAGSSTLLLSLRLPIHLSRRLWMQLSIRLPLDPWIGMARR
mmetsp:Transcript_1750/g.3905  ORF Transcript_1750/g.3905 Transcript_1750/m.3905 type:complete len:203 (-) Transcript_1750:339-947(-)